MLKRTLLPKCATDWIVKTISHDDNACGTVVDNLRSYTGSLRFQTSVDAMATAKQSTGNRLVLEDPKSSGYWMEVSM